MKDKNKPFLLALSASASVDKTIVRLFDLKKYNCMKFMR